MEDFTYVPPQEITLHCSLERHKIKIADISSKTLPFLFIIRRYLNITSQTTAHAEVATTAFHFRIYDITNKRWGWG